MRVTGIDLSANDQTVAKIGLRIPAPTDRFLAKGVYGLDADEIVPKFYAFGLQGGKYIENILKQREVVLRIVLNPNYALNERHGDLRDELYRIISASRTGLVKLTFRSGASSVAQLTGQVIKFESALTSKVPEVQLTIKCEDPMLRAVTQVQLSGVDLGATAPFKVTDALSTAPHGMYMEFTVTAAMDHVTISDHPSEPTWEFTIDPEDNIQNGDIIRISSQFKDKYVTIERAATVIPHAQSIAAGSLWPILFPGVNEFYFDTPSITWNEISYKPAYWGI